MPALTNSFAHLHLHTEFSMLDGAARVKEVIAAAVADGQPAIAITDHGVLYGLLDFYREANRQGIKPILGIEAYLTPGHRTDRDHSNNIRHHVTLLAENQVGYQNLIKLSSRAFIEGYFYKPRMDFELLAEHSEGIIATSGCLSGPVAYYLAPSESKEEGVAAKPVVRDFEQALTNATKMQEIFGKDSFFIEIMDHGLDNQQAIMSDLLDISRRASIPLLATNDVHYCQKSDHNTHDVLLCIQTNSKVTDPNRLKFDTPEFYLKTAAQMRKLFPSDQFPDACDNTLLIAERANVKIDFGEYQLPEFSPPEGFTEQSYLEKLVRQGATQLYGESRSEQVDSRINHELAVIAEMGFSAYFLIVWDLIRYAHSQGFRTGPGRGSAAGSIVAYCLNITQLDPIAHGLIFERFLNPGRKEMPDIDMDFDERHRGDVIEYVKNKYGQDHVAQIVTFATIKGKQAIRDAARVMNKPYALGDRLARQLPLVVADETKTLKVALDPRPPADANDDLKAWHAACADLRGEVLLPDGSGSFHQDEQGNWAMHDEKGPVLEAAIGLEFLRRQDSIHAAAVVIAPKPLTELVPLQRKGPDAEVVTQYEMGGVESLGLLKMDFLGLRNLTTIERALDLIEERTGERIDIDALSLDDQPTYRLLQQGATIGVFQLESSAMRSLLRLLRPDTFEDIVAANALFRPGPMGQNMHTEYAERKNGRSKVAYPHQALEPILSGTYGIIVYQEQVMEVARRLAGFSMAEADDLRKAMGKKVRKIMDQQRQKFIEGCVGQGYDQSFGQDMWDAVEPFVGYGFNKSHSACYALVAYQTAWLKTHYPAEYMAALLTSNKRDKDRTAEILGECRRMGIAVRVPDINSSSTDFTVVDDQILFGLSAIRHVGERVVGMIIEEREKNGDYQSFREFADRVHPQVMGKRIIDSLIKSGAFDEIEGMNEPGRSSRKGIAWSAGQLIDVVLERRRQEEQGQDSLFGGEETPEADVDFAVSEWKMFTKLRFEKEMLGYYISNHPLAEVQDILARSIDTELEDLDTKSDRTEVKVAGMVGQITRRPTRDGQIMMYFILEGLDRSVEVTVFPRTVDEVKEFLVEENVVLVAAKIDRKARIRNRKKPSADDDGEEEIQLIANRIRLLKPFGDEQEEDANPEISPRLQEATNHRAQNGADDSAHSQNTEHFDQNQSSQIGSVRAGSSENGTSGAHSEADRSGLSTNSISKKKVGSSDLADADNDPAKQTVATQSLDSIEPSAYDLASTDTPTESDIPNQSDEAVGISDRSDGERVTAAVSTLTVTQVIVVVEAVVLADPLKVKAFKQVLTECSGGCPVILRMRHQQRTTEIPMPPELTVQPNSEFASQITQVFGQESQVQYQNC